MDFEKLVEPIILFLNFYIGFWRGDQSIYSKFIGNGEISASALLLCLIGIGLNLAFRYATVGSVPTDPNSQGSSKPTLDTNSLLLRAFTGLASPLLFELSLLLLGQRNSISAPTEAVFNAFFVAYALIGPIAGAQSRVMVICDDLSKVGGKTASLATAFSVSIALLSVWAYYHCFKVLPAILEVPWSKVYPPLLLSFLLFLLVLTPIIAALIQWNKFVETSKNTKKS